MRSPKQQRSRRYPSHKNFKLPDENEIMTDQLTIILNTSIIASDLSDFQTQLQQLKYGDTEIGLVIDHFCQYIILQNKKSKQTFQVQFGDIVEFKHSHPLLINQQYFIDYSLLHCIDFEERKIVKIDNKKCLKKDKIVSEIKTLLLGNQNV